jgi:hypothetical protein
VTSLSRLCRIPHRFHLSGGRSGAAAFGKF